MSQKLVNSISVFLTLLRLTNGFVLRDMHTNYQHNNENEDFSVDLELNDDDYEMDNENEMDNPNITIQENRLDDFHELNGKENEKEIKSQCSATEWVKGKKSKLKIGGTETDNEATIETVAMRPSIHQVEKGKVAAAQTEKGYIYTEANEHPDSVSEKTYCAVKTGKFGSGFRILDSIKEIFSLNTVGSCTSEDSRGIGIRSIKCLFSDYNENRVSFEVLAFRLWNIAVIWLIVYLVVAIPLWCTKGWCCCCLCCKFFKPQETIQETKMYLLMNPPGILVTKKGGIIHYEPTEREKHCFEEFNHFIRTL